MSSSVSLSARKVPQMRFKSSLLCLTIFAETVCADVGSFATRVFGAEPAAVDESAWKLRVVNGGTARATADLITRTSTGAETSSFDDPASRAAWSLQLGRVAPPHAHRMYFGTTAGLPVAGDFNGDGFAEQGMFVDGRWFIDLNGTGSWDAGDLQLTLGRPGDLPVVGDWDGDGKADVGVYSIDEATRFGRTGEQPIVGDWTGNGQDTVGLFQDGVWRFDLDADGVIGPDEGLLQLGQPGDRPVVGDFNRDGRDDLGVYRAGAWLIDTSGDRRFGDNDLRYQLGDDGDTPVVGDWDGDGRDQIGVAHRSGRS